VLDLNKAKGVEMKKLLVVLVLLCTVGGLLLADDFTNCLNCIDKKLDDSTVTMIQRYSVNLTEAQKYSLYESNKKSTTVPFVVNFLLGAGIGSYIQGDTTGGTVALTTELLGGAMYLIGSINAVSTDTGNTSTKGITVAALGLVTYAVGRIYSWIRPFTYASNYNKRLSKALYGAPTVALIPTIDEIGNTGWTLSAKIDL
jgi:hypothetical protein